MKTIKLLVIGAATGFLIGYFIGFDQNLHKPTHWSKWGNPDLGTSANYHCQFRTNAETGEIQIHYVYYDSH